MIAAALAHPQSRTVWARLVLGESVADAVAGLPAARAPRALAALRQAGLVRDGPDGEVAGVEVFAGLLRAAAPPVRIGIDRFLRDGRIHTYPASQGERHELFAWVVERAISPGEELDEKAVNARLAAFHDDVAVLRRYLVDAGLLERTRSGSSYARVMPR